jgi:hypothetical protein
LAKNRVAERPSALKSALRLNSELKLALVKSMFTSPTAVEFAASVPNEMGSVVRTTGEAAAPAV